MKDTLTVDLSSPQKSAMGRMLFDLYNHKDLLDLLDSKTIVTGFPHNGGSHTLRITGTSDEVIDFIRILKNEYTGKVRVELHKVHAALLNSPRVSYMSLRNKDLS